MSRDLIFSVAGTVLGSLIEEGVEEVFPGVGELGFTGEIAGAITGLLTSELTKKEARDAVKTFVTYVYRRMNADDATDAIPEEDLNTFAAGFRKLPKAKKKEIVNNFRRLAPYEYQFILDFLRESEAT